MQLPHFELRDYIAVSSLIISLFTAYWNILRGPKFISPPLRWILIGLLPESNALIINFPVAITNIGSRTGVIDSFYVELTNVSTSQKAKFYAWQEGSMIGQDFQGFKADIPTPVSLKSGESNVKYYIFSPDILDYMYECGLHKLSLHAYVGGRQKSIKLYEQRIEIESILQPSSYSDAIPVIYSYNLFPKKVLKLSDYGTNWSSPISIIELAKK